MCLRLFVSLETLLHLSRKDHHHHHHMKWDSIDFMLWLLCIPLELFKCFYAMFLAASKFEFSIDAIRGDLTATPQFFPYVPSIHDIAVLLCLLVHTAMAVGASSLL